VQSLNLNFDVTPVFEKNFDSKKKIVINRGGTRSSKTYSLAQLFVIFLFTDTDKSINSIVRKTLPALKATAMRDVIEVLHSNDLYQYVTHNKTENFITYNGNMLEFFSVDDEQKVRGRKRKRLWANEANELNFHTEFRQLILRTTGQVYLDFNPDDENVWINTEIEQKRFFDKGDVEIIVSNYLDNTFLDQATIEEIEYLRKTDPQFWKVFGLGEYGKITGLVFEQFKVVEKIPEGAKLTGYGLDFGFTNDPTACLEVYQQDGELWINELIYETGLTNPDISDRLNSLGVKRHEEIIADSAEPKSVQELYNLRWNVKPALKGKDSIRNSIDILKRYPLNVTAKSVNLIKELKRYKWAVDKNGQSLSTPIDSFNHAIDALRYLALNKLAKSNEGNYYIY
jgi:phage terminase large subunit